MRGKDFSDPRIRYISQWMACDCSVGPRYCTPVVCRIGPQQLTTNHLRLRLYLDQFIHRHSQILESYFAITAVPLLMSRTSPTFKEVTEGSIRTAIASTDFGCGT